MIPATSDSRRPWHRVLLAKPGAMIALLLSVGMAWYLDPAQFGVLQGALGLAALLATAASLEIEDVVRAELRRRPGDVMETLGTAMGFRAAVGAALYFLLLIFLPSTIGGASRGVWLVAALSVLLQAPMIFALRFEKAPHFVRWGEQLGFAVSALALLVLLWHGGSVSWFAAALVLQPPIAALVLFFAHMRIAPDEETFTWDWRMGFRWLRHCSPRVAAAGLNIALLSLAPVVAVASTRVADEAGTFALALVYLVGGYSVARVLLAETAPELARSGKPDTAAETAKRLLTAGRIGWSCAGAVLALGVLGRYTWLRAYTHTEWLLISVALAVPALVLGSARNELWRTQSETRALAIVQSIGLVVTLLAVGILSHYFGPVAAAIALAAGVFLENILATFFVGEAARACAPALFRAYFLRGEPAPKPAAVIAPAPANPSFFADTKTLPIQDMGAATPVDSRTTEPLPPGFGLKTHDPA